MSEPGRHAARSRGKDRRWWIAVIAALGLAAFLGGYLVAVAGDDEEVASPSPTTTAPTGAAVTPTGGPTTTVSATSSATEAAVLEDGDHFVQPTSMTQGGTYQLTFDLGYFYTGAEAFEYAEEHDIELTNDYVIVNDNPKLRTLPFASEASVQYIPVGTCCELVDGNLDALAESVNGTNQTDYPDPETAWWFITVEGGQIQGIVQQYLP